MTVPIKRCSLPGGRKGFKYGDRGKCYADRGSAERQAAAIHASGYTENRLDRTLRVDPTRTVTQRRAFLAELRRVWGRFAAELVDARPTTNSILGKLFGVRGANCGIGAGGFLPGNRCAVGGGGGGASKSPGTGSAEFKAWFGQSRVVDAAGDPQATKHDPRVVYHGNPRGVITEFKKEWTTKRPEDMHFGPGFYFTEDHEAGKAYAAGATGSSAKGAGGVGRYYLKGERPFDADRDRIDPSKLPEVDRKSVRAAVVQRVLSEEGRSEALEAGRRFDAGELRMKYSELTSTAGVGGYGASKVGIQEHLKSLGHDSITVVGPSVQGGGENRFWVVFEPTQIKSVDAKKFDPKDPVTTNALEDLDSRIERYFLSEKEQRRWGAYVEGGYRRGVGRAVQDARVGDSRVVLGRAGAVEQLRFLQTKALKEVHEATVDFRDRARAILTDSVVRGYDPTRKLSAELNIGYNRAAMIAETELTRAHAEGQLTALDNLGVEEIGVEVEWHSSRVPCGLCSLLAGKVYTVAQARGLLPRHPRCKCAFTLKPMKAVQRVLRPEAAGTTTVIGNAQAEDCLCTFGRLWNSFCPTGPGGGVDPTCSPGGGHAVHTEASSATRQKWADDLPKAHKDILEFWSMGNHDRIRTAQAKGEMVMVDAKDMADFDAATSSAPKYQGTIYRGLRSGDPKMFDAFKEGAVVVMDASASASKDIEIAAGFLSDRSHNVIMEIRQKSAADVSKAMWDGVRHQREVITPKDAKYRVLSIKEETIPVYSFEHDSSVLSDSSDEIPTREKVKDLKPLAHVKIKRVVMEEQ